MGYLDFFEPAFDASSSAWEAGLQGAASSLPGSAGVPLAFPSLLLRRLRRRKRSKKIFSGDTPEAPGRGTPLYPRNQNTRFKFPGCLMEEKNSWGTPKGRRPTKAPGMGPRPLQTRLRSGKKTFP